MDLGDEDAAFRFGLALRKGIYVEKDLEKSKLYIILSACLGNKSAAVYINNGSYDVNRQECIRYLESSANSGNGNAALRFSDMLNSGIDVKKDVKKAHLYLILATSLRNEEAKRRLDYIDKNILSSANDFTAALEEFYSANNKEHGIE